MTKKQLLTSVKEGLEKKQEPPKDEIDFSKVVSTGSTLLDLAISGTSIRGGGIPPGILVEIFGPSGWGKTSLLGEICANVQSKGGFAKIGDAERRMTPKFIKTMGIKITKDNLSYPHTVDDIEEMIFNTPETGNDIIDITGIDSIASLLSSQETVTDKNGEVTGFKKDLRGSARAKDLHGMCRRAKAEIAKKNRLVVFTNQIQDVQDVSFGPKEKTPGGHAIPYYSSLRLRVGPAYPMSKIHQEETIGNKKLKQEVGIRSNVFVAKSSIDIPYREEDVIILFNYGIDDIRGNLEFIKKMSGSTKYWAVDQEFQSIAKAISHIEENEYEKDLREATIDLWEEIQRKFQVDRIPKRR